MTASDGTQAQKHTIPIIDRMMDVLAELERYAAGRTIRELTESLSLPRTTVYRLLNSLQSHDVVRRDDSGAYHLGRRLLSLAAHTSTRFGDAAVATICQPYLDKLAAEIGEGVKLSVLDDDGVVVIAVAQGRREYALTVATGQRMPIHASAAGKVILAHIGPEALGYWLSRPMPAYTGKTVIDTKRLKIEFATIRRRGWAEDKGETAPSILAYAAPVYGKDGRVAAALSVPFLAGTPISQMEKVKAATVSAAHVMSTVVPD
jgi:DNA-binding IclR family transcriptional regulator